MYFPSVVYDLLFNVLLIFLGVLRLSLFCYALFCVHSSFATILKWKRTSQQLDILPTKTSSYNQSGDFNNLIDFLSK